MLERQTAAEKQRGEREREREGEGIPVLALFCRLRSLCPAGGGGSVLERQTAAARQRGREGGRGRGANTTEPTPRS